MNAAVFLDRDNTLIHNDADLGDPEKVEMILGCSAAIASLRGLGYRIVVVTNQGGVARGNFSEDDVDAVHNRINEIVQAQSGASIDRFYYCPYHPEGTVEAYCSEHPWRKPAPGMLLEAAKDMNLDLSQSWMIGDQLRDIEAGLAAGVRTILLTGDRPEFDDIELDPEQSGGPVAEGQPVRPHYAARNLIEAVRIVAQQRRPDAVEELHERNRRLERLQRAASAAAREARHQRQAPAADPPAEQPEAPEAPEQPELQAEADQPDDPPATPRDAQGAKQPPAPEARAQPAAAAVKTPPRPEPIAPRREPSAEPAPAKKKSKQENSRPQPKRPPEKVEPKREAKKTPTPADPAPQSPPEPAAAPAPEPAPAPDSGAPSTAVGLQLMRQILQELRRARGEHDDFSIWHVLAMILQAVAAICLLGALVMGRGDDALFLRWISVGLFVQLSTIACLQLRR